MVSIWSNNISPWSPCSLPRVLVFSMSLHVWGERCEEQDVICLDPMWESQQPCILGDSMPRGDVGPVCLPPSKADHAQCWLSRSQCSLLMLQTPSYFNGLRHQYLLKYLYLKETTWKAKQVWPWIITGVSAKTLSSGGWTSSSAILLTLSLQNSPFPKPHPGFQGPNCWQLVSPNQRLQACPDVPLPNQKLLTACCLVFSLCFQLPQVKAMYMVQYKVWVDRSYVVVGWGTSSLPTLCRWRKCPPFVALFKEVTPGVTFKGKPMRLEKREKNMPDL